MAIEGELNIEINIDFEKLNKTFQVVSHFYKQLQDTILVGWPEQLIGLPTPTEAEQIVCIHHEIMLHEPELAEETAWRIAGTSVARFRRDIKN